MHLPNTIKEIIEDKLSKVSLSRLSLVSQQLSERYRIRSGSYMRSQEDYLAYLTTRFPATYAVISSVLSEVSGVKSILDVGAGPGTGVLAAQEIFDLERATLVEKEKGLIALGKTMPIKINSTWLEKDLESASEFEKHDLVLMSYSLGELKDWEKVVKNLWNSTDKFLIIIEPGTPVGFQRILRARQILIDCGGFVIAPCPHQGKCPLGEGDWCHFAQRVERSSAHRKAKDAELNYEDEKYSYVIFSKEKRESSGSRVIRRPEKFSGYVKLVLCSDNGIENKIISRKQKEVYRAARKANWGSLFNLNNTKL